jgi:hypothetical protein
MPRSRSSLITAALAATVASCAGYGLAPSAGTQSLEEQRQAAIALLRVAPADAPACGEPSRLRVTPPS